MKRILIKSLLISGLILGSVWNYEVAYSSDDPSRAIPYDAGLSSNRGVTLKRAEEILREKVEPVYGENTPCREAAEMWKETGLLSECSEEEIVNITIAAYYKLSQWHTRWYKVIGKSDFEQTYTLYKRGFLGAISNQPGLYPTELSKKRAKEAIKQIYMLYDLLKYRVLKMNEEDITKDEYIKVYLLDTYRAPRKKREETLEEYKKDLNEAKIKNILKKCRKAFRKYQQSFREDDVKYWRGSGYPCSLDVKIELLGHEWTYSSILKDLNDLKEIIDTSLRVFAKEDYDQFIEGKSCMDNNIFFLLFRSINDFFEAFSPYEMVQTPLETIWEEVDEEYESKDGLALAYCNYHFSYDSISSSDCWGLKERLKLKKRLKNVDEDESKDALISEDYDSDVSDDSDVSEKNKKENLGLLLGYFENASLSNPIFIKDIMKYAKPVSSSYNCLNDLEKLFSLMESNHCYPAIMQYFKEEPLKLEPLDMEEQERKDKREEAKEKLKKKKEEERLKENKWLYLLTGENLPLEEESQVKTNDFELISLLRERKYTKALMLYDVANEDSEHKFIYQAISYLENQELLKLFIYKYHVSDQINCLNVRALYDKIYEELDKDGQKKLRNEIKKRLHTKREISIKYYHYFNELIKLVEFMQEIK